jgi:hypothetical protein
VTKQSQAISQRVLRPKTGGWKLKQAERDLFESAEQIPNWRLADKSRRLLMDMVFRLSNDAPKVEAKTVNEAPAALVRQAAVVSLAGLTVRAAGSSLALISCGYVPESCGPARRALEASLRAQAVLADESGQHAREWLVGKPMGSAERLAQRYGSSDDLRRLSLFAHADVKGLAPMFCGPPGTGAGVEGGIAEVNLDLRPSRDSNAASFMLHSAAHTSVMMCAALAEAFEVAFEIPPWISSELIRMKDVVAEMNERRKAKAA